ncbi:MAG: hypothetical protein WC499_00710 [Patescibacteria group bacterium]|nr:hypothetical protein [Patescibacteria group bacterium]
MRKAIVLFIVLCICLGIGWSEGYFGFIDANQLVNQGCFSYAFSAYFVCGGLTVVGIITLFFIGVGLLGWFCALMNGTIDDY